MKKRIMRSSVIIALFAAVLSLVMSTGIYFNSFEKTMISQSKSQVDLLVEIVKDKKVDEAVGVLDDLQFEINARITLVDYDGTVLYDSDFNHKNMDNHASREEIADAYTLGYGQSQRYSDTANKTIYYSAVNVEDLGIVRIGVYSNDVTTNLIGDNILVLLLLIAIVVILCYFIASKTTKRVASLIENYDVENAKGELYEEMSAFVLKINSQNSIINEQVQNIKAEKDKLQNVFLNITEGIIVCNKEGTIIQVNKESESIFNIQNINTPFSSQVRSPELQKAMWRALEGEKQSGIAQYNKKYYQYTIGPNVHEDTIQGAILITLDITPQIENQNARKEFSDNVTHELKTPLTSILGYAQLIGEGIAKDEDVVPFAKIVESNAQKLLEMIDNVINLSAIEEGVELNIEDVNLSQVFKKVIEEVSGAIKAKNIEINFKGEDISLNADENQMSDMARNLISNAIKYNNEDGKVNIEIIKDDNIKIIVEDTGIGINAKDIDKIFERFYVADTSRNKKISSTGLGLSIVKHIVEKHGGSIDVKSKENVGTTFYITLPNNK